MRLKSIAYQISSWCFFAALLASAVLMAMTARQMRRDFLYGGVIAFDGAARQMPAYLSTKVASLVTVASDSPSYAAVERQATAHAGGKPVKPPFGMFEAADHSIRLVTDQSGLIANVSRLYDQDNLRQRPKVQYIFALAAFAIGSMIGRPLRRYGFAVAGACAVLAALLVQFRCRTCPVSDTFLGIDVAKLALGTFGVACLAALPSLRRWTEHIYLPLFIATGTVQLGLFWQATHLCLYCLSILSLGSLYIGSYARTLPEATEIDTFALRPRVAALSCGIASFAVLLLEMGAHHATARSEEIVASRRTFKSSPYKGLSLAQLGIAPLDELKSISKPAILVIGTKTCQPCADARFWASTQPDFGVAFVDGYPEKTDLRASGGKQKLIVLPDFVGTYSSPTLLVIGKDGKVADSYSGWAEDANAKRLLHDQFAGAVQPARKPSEPRKDNED